MPSSFDRLAMGDSDREWRSALPAIGLYLGLVGILLWVSLARTGGTFVYAQDDPYIHLALARTLADHGVWGIRPGQFASASSSPLWTVLLAVLWKLGAHAVWVPFALNILFGVAFLVCCWVVRSAAQAFSARSTPAAVLCALVVITPAPDAGLHRHGTHAPGVAGSHLRVAGSPNGWRESGATGCGRQSSRR